MADGYPRVTCEDIHILSGGTAAGEIRFEYLFRGLPSSS